MTEPASGPPLEHEQGILSLVLAVVLVTIAVVAFAVWAKERQSERDVPDQLPPIQVVATSPEVYNA